MNELRLPQSPDKLAERLKSLHEERKKFPRPPRRLSLTSEQRANVLNKTDARCHLCGGEFPENKFAADHVLSHAAGGKHKLANYLPSHRLCNGCRWFYSQEEFSGFLGWAFGCGNRWKTRRQRSAGICLQRSGNTRKSCQKDAGNVPPESTRGDDKAKQDVHRLRCRHEWRPDFNCVLRCSCGREAAAQPVDSQQGDVSF